MNLTPHKQREYYRLLLMGIESVKLAEVESADSCELCNKWIDRLANYQATAPSKKPPARKRRVKGGSRV